jgi:hypothetical protein
MFVIELKELVFIGGFNVIPYYHLRKKKLVVRSKSIKSQYYTISVLNGFVFIYSGLIEALSLGPAGGEDSSCNEISLSS